MKTKNTRKKAVSVLLAAVMLAGMIPMGAIGINAETITVPSANASGSQTYIIKTVDDWNAVASASASGNDFSGDTVKLGASISGVTLTTLFSNDFKGTFDGGASEGFSISSVTLNGSMIAKSAKSATIQNLKVDKATLTHTTTSAANGFDKVALIAAGTNGATLRNITISNSTSSVASYDNAFLVGYAASQGATKTKISDCEINNCQIFVHGASGVAVARAQNCDIDGLKVVGCTLQFDGTQQGTSSNATSKNYKNSGVGGAIGLVTGNATVKNSTVEVDITDAPTTTKAFGVKGLSVGVGEVKSGGSLTISDSSFKGTITSIETTLGGVVGSAAVASGKTFKLQNVTYSVELTSNSVDYVLADAIGRSTGAGATEMVLENVKAESGKISSGAFQYTQSYKSANKDVYAIRFIGVSKVEDPASVGMTVVAKDENGVAIRTFTADECKLYDAMKGYSPADGAEFGEYSEGASDTTKFMAVIIENIPVGTAYTFEITPYYVTADGASIIGATQTVSFGGNGTPVLG